MSLFGIRRVSIFVGKYKRPGQVERIQIFPVFAGTMQQLPSI